jgi:hypothetical protein
VARAFGLHDDDVELIGRVAEHDILRAGIA